MLDAKSSDETVERHVYFHFHPQKNVFVFVQTPRIQITKIKPTGFCYVSPGMCDCRVKSQHELGADPTVIKSVHCNDLCVSVSLQSRLEFMWAMKAYNHAEVYFNVRPSIFLFLFTAPHLNGNIKIEHEVFFSFTHD